MRRLGNSNYYKQNYKYSKNRAYSRRVNKKRMAIFIIILAIGLIVLFACIGKAIAENKNTVSQEQYVQLQTEVENAKSELADLLSENKGLKENNPLIIATNEIISEMGIYDNDPVAITLIASPSNSEEWKQYNSIVNEWQQYLDDSYSNIEIKIKQTNEMEATEQLEFFEESIADGTDAFILVNNMLPYRELAMADNAAIPVVMIEI